MTNESTKIVVSREEVDLKVEAKKQFRMAAVDSLQCTKKPAKDFVNCVVDYLVDRFINWVDNKLSA